MWGETAEEGHEGVGAKKARSTEIHSGWGFAELQFLRATEYTCLTFLV